LTGEIDSGEFERLRRKLKADGENIKRGLGEHRALSQTGDGTYEDHLRKRGENSSISGSVAGENPLVERSQGRIQHDTVFFTRALLASWA
jgi:hypothetical protein